MRLEFQLQCGHRQTFRDFPNPDVYCPECDAIVRIFAVECREYKVACTQCRYARWAGASRESAEVLRRGHVRNSGHERFTLDYLQHPDKVKKVRQIYPKIHCNILATRELPRNPVRYKITPDIPPF